MGQVYPLPVILISKTYWGGFPWMFRAPPRDADLESKWLRTEDFRQLHALLWTPRGRTPRVGVVVMHPRVDFTHHYCVPRLVDAGFAVLAANSRSPNDDSDCVHEDLLLDVGACIRFLKERRGIEQVVLFGNSGGGSLFGFYQSQAQLPPAERLTQTAAGDPTKLRGATLMPADLLCVVAAHRGQGQVLLGAIDPSVVDEDGSKWNRDLDMYDPRNGHVPAPASSQFDPEFVRRYRAAQEVRVQALDERAHAVLGTMREAAAKAGARDFDQLDPDTQRATMRAAHAETVWVVPRTMANLNYTDLSLDPSPREYGSLISDRPDLMNVARIGFARTVTPRGWLSTWSGRASNANLEATLATLSLPTLMVHAEKDKEVFPSDVARLRAAMHMKDATFQVIEGAAHYFQPDELGAKHAPDVERLMDVVVPWIEERVDV